MATVQLPIRNGQSINAADLTHVLPALAQPFAAAGAAALIVVRAPFLTALERCYGPPAFDGVTGALLGALQQFAGSHFHADEFIVASTPHIEEAVILVIRARANHRFYSQELPQLTRKLADHVEQQANRIVYPYGVESPSFCAGCAVAVHNPSLHADRQLLVALDNAREDAQLYARLRKREMGQLFLDLLLGANVQTVYQPVVGLQNGKILGYEALARGPRNTPWHSPAVLFKVAEEHDLAFELDCLCRKVALNGSRKWAKSGLKLFLNCLPSAIHDPNFGERNLRHTLESCGLKPSDLVLEISERESIKNFSIFRDICERYRSFGIKVALDDTGAGYAGLEAVMQLAPDYIKADISLVRAIDRDSGRRVLLQALQNIAEEMGAQVIAEGIETEEEFAAVRRLGIPFGQGYLLGRPVHFSDKAPQP
jgi:EAL domain-containing protein (putative c-di-GMP-specific phosphodiesterase class I)